MIRSLRIPFLGMVCWFWMMGSYCLAGPPAPPDLASQLQTGTLIFSKGDCLAVKVFTASSYTHVATVVLCDGEPIVYDSMNGVGVRKLPLQDYLASQAPDRVHLFHPHRPLTESEQKAFQAYLDSCLGTPYAVLHHVTGQRCEGVHCAEYVTDALQEIRWLKATSPPRVSPASLAQGIEQGNVYHAGPTIELAPNQRPVPSGETRCEQLWIDTKLCTQRCCRQLSRWFLCR